MPVPNKKNQTLSPIANNSLSNLTDETYLVAGFKVVDKAGGPVLVVIGFTDKSYALDDKTNQPNTEYIFLKVFININRKKHNELTGAKHEFVNSYYFFKDVLSEWDKSEFWPMSNEKDRSNCLYLVCKFWDNQASKFIYSLKSLVEVETISEGN